MSWKDNVRRVTPYVPGEQPKDKNVIKLNTNENPYPPAPGVMEALKNVDDLRKYPDPNVTDLVNELASYHGFEPSEVFVGVGSDDVLAMSFLTFFNSEKPVLFPDITYSFYDVWADLYGIKYECQPLDDNFNIVKEDYYKENGGVIFPNPNAPTAISVDESFIRDIIEHNKDSLVIIDEAYVDFGGKTVMPLVKEYDNLLVVRTFSKSRSLAGMRIGYCVGNAELIAALNDVKQSFNSYTMSRAAIAAGVASVQDEAYFRAKVDEIIKTREWTVKELNRLGFTCPESSANFIFATHESRNAKELFEALKAFKIFVRYFDKPRINNYLRITIGTDDEMKALVGFLEGYLEA